MDKKGSFVMGMVVSSVLVIIAFSVSYVFIQKSISATNSIGEGIFESEITPENDLYSIFTSGLIQCIKSSDSDCMCDIDYERISPLFIANSVRIVAEDGVLYLNKEEVSKKINGENTAYPSVENNFKVIQNTERSVQFTNDIYSFGDFLYYDGKLVNSALYMGGSKTKSLRTLSVKTHLFSTLYSVSNKPVNKISVQTDFFQTPLNLRFDDGFYIYKTGTQPADLQISLPMYLYWIKESPYTTLNGIYTNDKKSNPNPEVFITVDEPNINPASLFTKSKDNYIYEKGDLLFLSNFPVSKPTHSHIPESAKPTYSYSENTNVLSTLLPRLCSSVNI